jgi:hypothetical protein
MKILKDYVHFFLGCQFQLFWRNDDGTTEYERDGELVTIRPQDKDTHGLVFRCKTKGGNFIEMAYPFEDVKPIFKPLSDYKEISSEGLNDINCDLSNQMEIVDLANKQLHYSSATFETVRLCLENRVDVFNLIDEGLAVNATELKAAI